MKLVKRYLLPLLVALVIFFCYLRLSFNRAGELDKVMQGYTAGTVVNLDRRTSEQQLAELLVKHGYLPTAEDARFAAGQLVARLKGDTVPQSLFELGNRKFQLLVSTIDSVGSPYYRQQAEWSRQQLGIDETVRRLYAAGGMASDSAVGDGGKYVIRARVSEPLTAGQAGFWKKVLRRDKRPSPGVIVRLDRHFVDSTDCACTETVAYAMTDRKGQVAFTGLDGEMSYSVLPIRPGFEYGQPKGTTKGRLADHRSADFAFTASPHRVRLFDSLTLRRMKEDGVLTVRTPEAFKVTVTFYVNAFLVAWLLLFAIGRAGRRQMDTRLAAWLMLLTGMSMLLMFGINEPLSERILGVETAQGILGGIGIACILQWVDLVALYRSPYFDVPAVLARTGWRCLDFLGAGRLLSWSGKKLQCRLPAGGRLAALREKGRQMAVACEGIGIGYLLTALLLTGLLFLIGQEVGGMKVNLNFGFVFQPSEIAKYLMVVFMAAYFCRRHLLLYETGNAAVGTPQVTYGDFAYILTSKARQVGSMLLGLLLLMGMYLVLGDMGPALVLALTFIVLYAIVQSKAQYAQQEVPGWKELLEQTDLGMLLVGAVSFMALLLVGSVLDCTALMATLWLLGWVLVCWTRKKVFDAAVMFNCIVALFVFGGALFSAIGFSSVGERLETRNEMCTNTWGNLGLDGAVQDAGENSQVAEGLWGLASGGFWGQGIGNGAARTIPAFHTDMILQSIGEQWGFVGVLCVVVLLSLILRRSVLVGYRSGHTFTLYLCTGIAVVTGVQFFIIALGSTGVIPLTGITVPMLSFGRVSMILNLAAFGAVLSVSAHHSHREAGNNRDYRYTVALLSLVHCLLALLVMGVFFHYQVTERDKTLIRPVFVNNVNGIPVIRYNPRIAQLTEEMQPGDIRDRNGLLLATSSPDKLKEYAPVYKKCGLQYETKQQQRRYYPFGAHTFFMVGDNNTRLFFSSSDNGARGYMAEARHLATLRGYDNVLYDEAGRPVKVDVRSSSYRPGRFLAADKTLVEEGVQLRDYSALLPYLKAGIGSRRVQGYNERNEGLFDFGKIRPADVQLTMDAVLQTTLQQKLAAYEKAGRKRWHSLQRVSVVILDAAHGDLLASAVWPLPDRERLAAEGEDSYKDYGRPVGWQAYTDMDLGLCFPTPPGSTAKVMSALAGLRSLDATGGRISDKKYSYRIYPQETIHQGRGGEPVGTVHLHDAIVQSSNCYFIHLVNDLELYDELAYIYSSTGVQMGFSPWYRMNFKPYDAEDAWTRQMTDAAGSATRVYRDYMASRNPAQPSTLRRMVLDDAWRWTWGQGTISATPAAMARVASIVANRGKLVPTRFVLEEEPAPAVDVVSAERIAYLYKSMSDEATKNATFRRLCTYRTGGKTGTPERFLTGPVADAERRNKPNDAWYICYVDGAAVRRTDGGKVTTATAPLAIAVRVERTGNAMSGFPKVMTEKLVMETLKELGYLPASALRK